MAFIDGTVVNVALPALQVALGATVSDVQWIVESYALFLAALLLPGGSLGDLYGRRKMFVAGVLVFGGASACCGFAQDIHQLIAARALQGIGGALLVPGSLALISASFPAKERGRAIGTWSGFTAITAAIGPVLGGWLIQHASWRWVFFINLPIAVVVLTLTMLRVPESRNPERSHGDLDWIGALLATLGLGGIVFALIEPSYGLVAGAVGMLALIAQEIHHRVGIPANIAIAANPDAAVYAAQGLAGITVIPPGHEMQVLAPLSLIHLSCPPEMGERFELGNRILQVHLSNKRSCFSH
jgi:MFS family permease